MITDRIQTSFAVTWIVLAAGLAGAGPADPPAARRQNVATVEWPQYGADTRGQRFSPLTEIAPDNIHRLRAAWVVRTGDYSHPEQFDGSMTTFKATPVFFAGLLYLSTPFNRVLALDGETGSHVWSFDPEVSFAEGFSEMFTSRGVSTWRDSGRAGDGSCARRIFLGTLDARLIALDAASGLPCADFGAQGTIDLSRGIENYRAGEYSLTSPVTVVGDRIIVGSSIGDNGGVELDHGTVRAFDARTGKLLWSWDPIPRHSEEDGWETWEDGSGKRTGAANAWSVISADPARNLVFVPTTSPSPDFFGGERRGDNLFANSVVALDATNGTRIWHFQTVHHDLWDFDLASQSALARLRRGESVMPVLIQATKMGHVFVLDRASGEPVFGVDERPVPQSDVTEEMSAPTQPFPRRPAGLHPARFTAADLWQATEEQAAFCAGLLKGLRNDGLFTPPSLTGTFMYPGNPGGANWGSMAVDENAQIALVNINRWPTIVSLIPRRDFAARAAAGRGGPLNIQFTAQSGTPYGMQRHDFFHPPTGLPCHKGPWGTLVAIDYARGEVIWEQAVGRYAASEQFPAAAQWGTILRGGPIVTAAGIVFVPSTPDRKLHAFGLRDGARLWEASLPAGPHATPMTYATGGRQYVVVTAGGESAGSGLPGDYVVAFALEDENAIARGVRNEEEASLLAVSGHYTGFAIFGERFSASMDFSGAPDFQLRGTLEQLHGAARGRISGHYSDGKTVSIDVELTMPGEDCTARLRADLAQANRGQLLTGALDLFGSCASGGHERGILSVGPGQH